MKARDGRNVSAKRFAQEYIWNAYIAGKDRQERPKTEKQIAQFEAQLEKILTRIKKILKVEDEAF